MSVMKFKVNYSVNMNYDVIIEADSEEEAEDLVDDGDFNDDDAVLVGEQFLSVNNVEVEEI